jgi:predicted metal-dependent hydrolase
MSTIQYGTRTIEFEVQRNNRLKHTYITVERDCPVLVRANDKVDNEEIKKLVRKKAAWICSKLEELGQSPAQNSIITGSRLYYLGKSYYVELIKEEREGVIIDFISSKFKIHTPQEVDQEKISEAIEIFYLEKAHEKIKKLVLKWSNKMELLPAHIDFKLSNTKWGSCNHKNQITFNPELMKLSPSLIEYAVVHELAHIAYKNHSKEFWGLIKKHLSGYQHCEEQLKAFEKKI